MPMPLPLLADHLWQSTLVAALVWMVVRFLRANTAAVRHRLWLAASVKFLVPFWLLTQAGTLVQWPSAPVARDWSRPGQLLSTPFTSEALGAGATAGSLNGMNVVAILCAVWAIGALLTLGSWWYRWWQLRRVVARSEPFAVDAAIEARRTDVHGPGVFGIVRPVLLVPRELCERLTASELAAVVAHEGCHIRRRDNLAMSVHMIVEALFWFHPLVWWIERRLVEEQERACDEDVLAGGTSPRIYAEGLLKVCELSTPALRPWVAGMRARDLNRRIEDIMANASRDLLSWPKKAALSALALAAITAPIVSGATQASAQPSPSDISAWVGTWDMVVRLAQIPDPSGRKIGPYPYRWYRIQIERTPDRLRIVNSSQASVSGKEFHEEVVVALDGTPVPAADPENPGRTFALRRAAGNSFDLVRRTPRADGTIETVTQRYDLSVSGRLRVTYNSDNPPPAWLIGVLVLERVQ
jgi:beta-lactamase regulating signal transducer with metallopeptidase domain